MGSGHGAGAAAAAERGPALTVAAAGTEVSSSIAATFLQYGVLGAVAIVLLWFSFNAIVRERERADRETARADRAEAALAELNKDMREKVIPALTEATRVCTEAIAVIRGRP